MTETPGNEEPLRKTHPRSPRPAHPAVLNRRDFVEAAPALPGDPRFRLPPASSPPLRRRRDRGLPPPSGNTSASWRTISFCRLRTFFRSPACDAARSAAEDVVRPPRPAASPQRPSPEDRPRVRSPQRQSRPQPPPSWRPTCPSVPVLSISNLRRLTRRASAPFQARSSRPVSGRLYGTLAGRLRRSMPFSLLSTSRPSLLASSCSR